MELHLNTSLKKLTRIGQIIAGRLQKLGVKTVQDLIFYYPSRYEDYSTVVPIAKLKPGDKVTVCGQICSISNTITRYKRQRLTSATIQDQTGTLRIVWFNQMYLATQLKKGDEVSLCGEVQISGYGMQMASPEWEKGEPNVHTGRIVPIYALTAGLTQKQVRFLVSQAMKVVDELGEWMSINSKFKNIHLINLQTAIQNIHFPENNELLAQARFRLKFEELFWLQLKKALTRHQIRSTKTEKLVFKKEAIKNFVNNLPFKLTDAQRKVSWQILQDLDRTIPMNRLLQGDVGSGKTVVAVMALLNTALNGSQAVLMAPTEILAKQHYKTVCGLLEGVNVSIALMTRSDKQVKSAKVKDQAISKKVKVVDLISQGEASIIIGTHALIQRRVQFKKLGLVIVDEQHRFGVEQRKALKEKAGERPHSPHFLSMTATPIPRSLALTLYSDLDLSIIDEMPVGRKKIITQTVAPKDRQKAYSFINEQIKQGRQVFVICPLIDESDILGVKAVTTEFVKLDKQIFPHLRIGLLHGKLKDGEKDEVQQKFVQKKFDILVATSVVEVGVDVPNTTVMMIEGAERFGLAQLHQFRGRVGRSEHQSYCFLFTDSHSQNVYERLDFLSKVSDGFKIAEYDLKLRGAGDIYGTTQHGLPEFKIASFEDTKLIELTQQITRELINQDPEFNHHPKIKKRLEQVGGLVHLE